MIDLMNFLHGVVYVLSVIVLFLCIASGDMFITTVACLMSVWLFFELEAETGEAKREF